MPPPPVRDNGPVLNVCICLLVLTCRSALILYRQILDAIEANDYDNFSRRAYVPKVKKLASLPVAFARAVMPVAH